MLTNSQLQQGLLDAPPLATRLHEIPYELIVRHKQLTDIFQEGVPAL